MAALPDYNAKVLHNTLHETVALFMNITSLKWHVSRGYYANIRLQYQYISFSVVLIPRVINVNSRFGEDDMETLVDIAQKAIDFGE